MTGRLGLATWKKLIVVKRRKECDSEDVRQWFIWLEQTVNGGALTVMFVVIKMVTGLRFEFSGV